MPAKATACSISEKWHVAYFGTKVENLRKILDTGDLHSTGKTSHKMYGILVAYLFFRPIRSPYFFENLNFYFMKGAKIPVYGNVAVYIEYIAPSV